MNNEKYITNKYKWLILCIRPHITLWSLTLLLSAIVSLTGIAIAIITKNLIDFSVDNDAQSAILWGSLFALTLLTQFTARALSSYLGLKLSERMTNDQQHQFIEHILRSKWLAINNYHSGDLQTRITNDISKILTIWLVTIPSIITLVIQFFAAFLTLYVYDNRLAMLAFLITPVALILSAFIGRHLKKFQSLIQVAESKYRSLVNEVVSHSVIIKTFEHETESSLMVKAQQTERMGLAIKQAKFLIATQTIMRVAYGISFFAAFVWGSYRISLGLITFGTFTAFLQLVGQIQSPIDGLAKSIPQLFKSMSSIDRILEIYNLPLEELPKSLDTHNTQDTDSIGLSISNLTFSYTNNIPVINGAQLEIEAGEHCVIIGESGAGKTTFIRLLLALMEPQDGTIRLKSPTIDHRMVNTTTREFFTYVPQGDTLFSGTIRDNLIIGNPQATNEELNHALYLAAADDFVRRTPNGLDSIVGENGLGLSQGQAQRITIARALLRNSPILILDEATSALDQNTEANILTRINEHLPTSTIITITHRTSVFNICDNVYTLSQGKFKKYA